MGVSQSLGFSTALRPPYHLRSAQDDREERTSWYFDRRLAGAEQGGAEQHDLVALRAEDRRVVVDLEARAFNLDVQLVSALGGGFTA